jgi:hypothetical protein
MPADPVPPTEAGVPAQRETAEPGLPSEYHLPSGYHDAMRRGAAAEARFDFAGAVRHYLAAAELGEAVSTAEIRALMRAASCLGRQQNWRSYSAAWEKVGDRLGGEVGPSDEGQSGMYHVISYPGWEAALTDHPTDTAEPAAPVAEATTVDSGEIEAARGGQQRAWAYQWAAESAEYEGRHWYARRLFRKAGLAFLTSAGMAHWDRRTNVRMRLYETAAWCFYRAAWCNWQPGNLDQPDLDRRRISRRTEDRFNSSWTPRSILAAYPHDDADHPTSDLQRMRAAYLRYGEVVKSTALAYDCIAVRLCELQALLNLNGERRQSRRVYQLRRQAERRADLAELRRPGRERRLHDSDQQAGVRTGVGAGIGRRLALCARLAWAYTTWTLTGHNASLLRSLGALLVVYCVVFPALYLQTIVPAPGFTPDGTPRWVEALTFSLLTTVNLQSDRYTVVSVLGNLLEAIQGWSAFLALGYFIWLLTRQFDA